MLPINTTDSAQKLTAVEEKAISRLHDVAQQFEGVFLQMLLKSMRGTEPKETIFGKESNAESMFSDMLDDERAQSMAQRSTLGIAGMLETELRRSVLSNAAREAKANVTRGALR
jgi:flagellar protein FlgJ